MFPGHPNDHLTPQQLMANIGTIPKFNSLSYVGKGGFGVVISAKRDKATETSAVKLVPFFFDFLKDANQLLQEASMIRALDHPRIVKYKSIFLHKRADEPKIAHFCLEMPFYPEGDVAKLIDTKSLHITLKDICRYASQLLNGVHWLHSHNIIHRDLKTCNLLLSNGRIDITIIDFGLALDMAIAESIKAGGTTDWMSREMAEHLLGSGPMYDSSADIWVVGLILFELMTRRTADDRRGNILHAILYQLKSEEHFHNYLKNVFLEGCTYIDTNGAVFHFPDVLINFTLSLLRKDPKDRPTAERAFNQLQNIISDLKLIPSEKLQLQSEDQSKMILQLQQKEEQLQKENEDQRLMIVQLLQHNANQDGQNAQNEEFQQQNRRLQQQNEEQSATIFQLQQQNEEFQQQNRRLQQQNEEQSATIFQLLDHQGENFSSVSQLQEANFLQQQRLPLLLQQLNTMQQELHQKLDQQGGDFSVLNSMLHLQLRRQIPFPSIEPGSSQASNGPVASSSSSCTTQEEENNNYKKRFKINTSFKYDSGCVSIINVSNEVATKLNNNNVVDHSQHNNDIFGLPHFTLPLTFVATNCLSPTNNSFAVKLISCNILYHRVGLVPKHFSDVMQFIEQGGGWCLWACGSDLFGNWKRGTKVDLPAFNFVGSVVRFTANFSTKKLCISVNGKDAVVDFPWNEGEEVMPAFSLAVGGDSACFV